MNDDLTFNSTGEAAARTATAALIRCGLHVVRSFDLRSALTPRVNCDCPHHGTAQCTCQFVVLLVYGDPSTSFDFAQDRRSGQVAAAPLVLTLHSHGDRTSAQIVRDAASLPDPRLAEQVMAALTEAALTARS